MTQKEFIEETLKEFDSLFTFDCAGENPPKINCRHWKQEDNVGGVKQLIRTALEKQVEVIADEIETELKNELGEWRKALAYEDINHVMKRVRDAQKKSLDLK